MKKEEKNEKEKKDNGKNIDSTEGPWTTVIFPKHNKKQNSTFTFKQNNSSPHTNNSFSNLANTCEADTTLSNKPNLVTLTTAKPTYKAKDSQKPSPPANVEVPFHKRPQPIIVLQNLHNRILIYHNQKVLPYYLIKLLTQLTL